MFSLAGATVGVALFAGWAAARRLRLASTSTPEAFAGLPFRESVSIANTGRRLDVFGVFVDDSSARIPFVGRGAQQTVGVERLFRRRGVYADGTLEVGTGFPFGFFRFAVHLARGRPITVFPRIFPVHLERLAGRRHGSTANAERKGEGDEFFRLREYVPGDHPHHVHWKTSARLDELMVREFVAQNDARYCVLFVPVLPSNRDASDFELLVSSAASVVVHLKAAGAPYRFVQGEHAWPLRSSSTHTTEILTHLASVDPWETPDALLASRIDTAIAGGELVLLVAFDEVSRNLRSGRPELLSIDPGQLVSHGRPTHDITRSLV